MNRENHISPPARQISRRRFIYLSALSTTAALVDTAALVNPIVASAHHLASEMHPSSEQTISHDQYLQRIMNSPDYSEVFISSFKDIMKTAMQSCVKEEGEWIVPSDNYQFYYFSRDSYWLLAAIKDLRLLNIAARRFHEDQKNHPDGHIATALYRDGSHPENRDRDEESTMMDIFREWEKTRAGDTPDKDSLAASAGFVLSHVRNGKYYTSGEKRSGPMFDGDNQMGTYHYWADTFRPAGQAIATPEVITYNQGLLCVSLRCLEQMGVRIDRNIIFEAEDAYANIVNPVDAAFLPQRENSTIMDVSALAGEALSLYYFNRPLLSHTRVESTLNHLSGVYYPDGKFLGFKVISDYFGAYRPISEYSGSADNWPGNYQMGASWLLYDILALYCASRHNIPQSEDLILQRLQSELRQSAFSHEFIRTNNEDLGGSDKQRDDYGWNSFVLNLLP